MGASVPLSKESPITNTLHTFLVALVLMQVGGWTNFARFLSWVLHITHILFILQPQGIISVMQEHFRRKGKIPPPALSRDKSPVSFVL